ncbi:hypothetical protein ABT023_17615 [Micromonospora sp. NPDC002296]|uniref:hypothetical protein n=1 Tax=Micromonospora sp. NPDC002296 TaxID=3154271 RepID=UPI00332BFB25
MNLTSSRGVVTADLPGLPADDGLRVFADVLSQLSTSIATDNSFTIDLLLSDDVDEDWRGLVDGFEPPSGGVLAQLPTPAHIAIRERGDVSAVRWRDGGVVHGTRGTDRVQLIASRDATDLAWLLRYLMATPLVLWGALDVAHGCLVEWQGHNLLIAGPSHSGKSSLSILFALNGGVIRTEDVTYIDDAGRAAPVSTRTMMTMRQGTYDAFAPRLRQVLGEAAVAALGATMPSGRFDLSPFMNDDCRTVRPIDAVVFPRIVPAASDVRTVPLTDATQVNARCFERDFPSVVEWLGVYMSSDWAYASRGDVGHHAPAFDLELPLSYPHRFQEIVASLGL